MRFNPEIVDLQCQACGHIEVVEETRAEPPERVLSAVLRTSRGYRWASAERLLRCQQCGAQTIFPPAQTSINCPYCGNSAFGTTPEDQDLEVPQALIPMGLEADAARKKVLVWLGRGFLAPDDLARAVLHSLQPVYVPLWLFNAAVALSPVGHDKQVYLYANWAISGIRSLPARLIKDLGSVVWKNLIEFKPEYLAGWPASTYEVSAAAAAQQARQEMEADARSRTSRLPFDLNYSPASFSTESFWLVLFPIWISSYTYRKTIYRVLVNGETGQVAGDKPFSWLKVLIVAAAVAALSGAIGFILLRTLSAMALPTELSAQLQPILDALKPVSVLLTPAIIALIAMIVLAFRK
jgi:ribosomal protein S27E